MRFGVRALAPMLAIMLTGGTAQAAGPYVQFEAGLSLAADAAVDDSSGTKRKLSFDPGGSATFAGGYVINDSFRAEIEFGFALNNIDSFSSAGAPAFGIGDVNTFSIMTNLYYDLRIGRSKFIPFATVGLGAVLVNFDEVTLTGLGTIDDNDVEFAWQAGAGLSYLVESNWAVVLDYRYFAAGDPDFSGSGGLVASEYARQTIRLGARVMF